MMDAVNIVHRYTTIDGRERLELTDSQPDRQTDFQKRYADLSWLSIFIIVQLLVDSLAASAFLYQTSYKRIMGLSFF